MSEFKGTKGEWIQNKEHFNLYGKKCEWIEVEDKEGNTLAEVKGIHFGVENYECQYNAQLIAHSPQMLEMLKELMEDLEGEAITSGVNDTIRRAKQLIQQATTIK